MYQTCKLSWLRCRSKHFHSIKDHDKGVTLHGPLFGVNCWFSPPNFQYLPVLVSVESKLFTGQPGGPDILEHVHHVGFLFVPNVHQKNSPTHSLPMFHQEVYHHMNYFLCASPQYVAQLFHSSSMCNPLLTIFQDLLSHPLLNNFSDSH